MGRAYFVLPHEKAEEEELYDIHNFNLMVSDRIPVDRSLRDVRNKACRVKTYGKTNLPNTSVIIVFHNEAWSTLLRTVHSVVNRSPRRVLVEIILVDDASEREFLKSPLDDYVSQLPVQVRIIRSASRIGLIWGRLIGAQNAKGQVLTFLDSHCECTKGWLEPLLSQVAQSRSSVVSPVIDVIDEETFAYIRSVPFQKGAFGWELRFLWVPLTKQEQLSLNKKPTVPIRTPTLAGGLFSIDRNYFNEIGGYDNKMDFYGGENIELSLRVWQCGGSVEIAPCSHVGHVFRHSIPYTAPYPDSISDAINRNSARVALAWLDQWASFFFKMNPEIAQASKAMDLSSQTKLRRKLKCNSFHWYLENIWPDHFLPMKERFFGKILNIKSGLCIERSSSSGMLQTMGKLKLKKCALDIDVYAEQLYLQTRKGQIMSDHAVCLDALVELRLSYVITTSCSERKSQIWKYDSVKNVIIHNETNLCLDLPPSKDDEGVILKKCNFALSQQWNFQELNWLKV